ncbi:nucleotidyl transferase AbiEii/AbiGii toxin family protein [Bradyrhizobium sp. NBAIM03]|nr:nucleotidyl transferase AbiEii/AbiGii toxin family protein [Bradyrhizobium sp. NBAIM03]
MGENLVFKGGTSLPEAYGAVRRFPDDLDLTYGIRATAPNLAKHNR